MSTPFSLRLGKSTLDRLAQRSGGAGLAPRSLAQRYVEEGLRRDEHPMVRFADGPAGRRAAMVGSGLDVWEIVATVHDNAGDVRAAADYLGVPVHLIEAAVSYYGAFPAEIDELIEANSREAEQAHEAWLAGRCSIAP